MQLRENEPIVFHRQFKPDRCQFARSDPHLIVCPRNEISFQVKMHFCHLSPHTDHSSSRPDFVWRDNELIERIKLNESPSTAWHTNAMSWWPLGPNNNPIEGEPIPLMTIPAVFRQHSQGSRVLRKDRFKFNKASPTSSTYPLISPGISCQYSSVLSGNLLLIAIESKEGVCR